MTALTLTAPQLARIRWTPEKAHLSPFVSYRDDKSYVGDRRLITSPEEAAEVLKDEYKEVQPSIGYNAWFSIISQRYLGL